MDVEKIAMFAGVGFAIAVGLFVLWGPSPKPRKKGISELNFIKPLRRLNLFILVFHYSSNKTMGKKIMSLCVIDDIFYFAEHKFIVILKESNII